jgi:hypothetical protein
MHAVYCAQASRRLAALAFNPYLVRQRTRTTTREEAMNYGRHSSSSGSFFRGRVNECENEI